MKLVYKKSMLILTVLVVFLMVGTLAGCERKVIDKNMVVKSNVGDIEGAYTGTLVDGKPFGYGTLTFNRENGKRIISLYNEIVQKEEVYIEDMKYKDYYFDGNEISNVKYFNQKGNVIFDGKDDERGNPDLQDNDLEMVWDTGYFTKNNMWNFYMGLCEIYSVEAVYDSGAVVYEAYIINLSGKRDYDRVLMTYAPTDDDLRYGEGDILYWMGQFYNFLDDMVVISVYDFDTV